MDVEIPLLLCKYYVDVPVSQGSTTSLARLLSGVACLAPIHDTPNLTPCLERADQC